ncbi:MAG TPA: vanadium-dependent haloperoxidase [Acidimicrobiales bacterium]|nr:vanadium-dependent haloperoxidase [Acidimicrobiales bacterium]
MLVIAAALVGPGVATAEPAPDAPTSPQAVIEWSTEAQRAIVGGAGKSPPEAAVLMGIVHAAVYDTVVAIEGGARPYAIRPTVPTGASAEAATAAAAHRVLVGLLPAQRSTLDANYAAYLSRLPDDDARTGGVAVGEEVAAGILALRADDGRDDVVPYIQAPPGPGVYEPTAPFPPVGTNIGGITPLTLPRADLFRPPGPPELTSDRYARDVNEVAARGGTPPTHTPMERATVRVWADHGIPLWNRTLFRVIDDRDLSRLEAARLLVMAHASGADAMIGCFHAKYHHLFWRPVHAIRRADTDGNDATQANPSWTPVLGTPNHPEYPAAHNCHSTAVATAIAQFFGTEEVAITVDSVITGEVRTFDRLSEAVTDVVEARILGGVHFRSSAQDGAALGTDIARFATTTQFTRTSP